MAQKKDRSRFTIKFRENDPAHERTICILESQGQRNIAPFLVNTVLHYVQCSETPDMSRMMAEKPAPMVDKNAIEEIVWGILQQQGIIEDEFSKVGDIQAMKTIGVLKKVEEKVPIDAIIPQNIIDDNRRVIISKSLSMFRSDK